MIEHAPWIVFVWVFANQGGIPIAERIGPRIPAKGLLVG